MKSKSAERVKIGTDFDAACRKLKKLMKKFGKLLLKLSKGPKAIYVTTGSR